MLLKPVFVNKYFLVGFLNKCICLPRGNILENMKSVQVLRPFSSQQELKGASSDHH